MILSSLGGIWDSSSYYAVKERVKYIEQDNNVDMKTKLARQNLPKIFKEFKGEVKKIAETLNGPLSDNAYFRGSKEKQMMTDLENLCVKYQKKYPEFVFNFDYENYLDASYVRKESRIDGILSSSEHIDLSNNQNKLTEIAYSVGYKPQYDQEGDVIGMDSGIEDTITIFKNIDVRELERDTFISTYA